MDAGPVALEPSGRSSALRRGLAQRVRALAQAPAYPASANDLASVSLLGLRLPLRATVAVVLVTLVVLIEHGHDFLPRDAPAGRGPGDMRALALERLVLFGLIPLVTVVLILRDDPRRYGLRLGAWRLGLGLAVGASAVMTPIVLLVARIPEFQAFYAQSVGPLPGLVLTNALDLTSAEFLFRGLLLFALLRVAGPIAVLVATFPFVMTHLGKPEAETLSTLGGGLVFGWIDWRTGSILWSALFHLWILTLVIVAAAAGPS
jgi:membrane protease YdiL (CAAX protease family)